MTTSGADRNMIVDTRLASPHPWFILRGVAVESGDGTDVVGGRAARRRPGPSSLPADLLAAYDSVDVSLEPDDGVPAHSADSVLRAKYGSTS